MSPPRSRARWRLIDSPRPVPPYSRVVLLSTWRNSSKITPKALSGMPMPVSATVSVSPPSWYRVVTVTVPSAVNFTALLRRLMRICFSLSSSVYNGGSSAASAFTSRSRSLLTSGSTVRRQRSTSGSKLKLVAWTSMRPASILERSRMSLINARRCSALTKIFSRFSYWRTGSASLARRITSRVKPMIAFIGVRSSCDMLARKSDLCWEAAASLRLASSSSRVRSLTLASNSSAC